MITLQHRRDRARGIFTDLVAPADPRTPYREYFVEMALEHTMEDIDTLAAVALTTGNWDVAWFRFDEENLLELLQEPHHGQPS